MVGPTDDQSIPVVISHPVSVPVRERGHQAQGHPSLGCPLALRSQRVNLVLPQNMTHILLQRLAHILLQSMTHILLQRMTYILLLHLAVRSP